jgi:UDP-glucose 4-epimerase
MVRIPEIERILVTGGAGFIASHVADQLCALGYEVAVVDNLSTGRREFVPPAARFFPYDIKAPEAAELIEQWRPQVLVHHAAQMSVQASVADPAHDARENILGSLNLFQAAVRAGVGKIVFASTGGAIYGDGVSLPAREEESPQPESPYGIAKLAIEHYLRFYARQYGITCLCLRYANVYGPRQNGKGEAGVVAIFIEKFLSGQTPVINGDGGQTRDFVYVGDVVAANLTALEQSGGGIFNIGTGRETDINTIARHLQELTGAARNASHGPAKPGEQRRSVIDSRRAQEALGWEPRVRLEEGLALTVDYFKKLR